MTDLLTAINVAIATAIHTTLVTAAGTLQPLLSPLLAARAAGVGSGSGPIAWSGAPAGLRAEALRVAERAVKSAQLQERWRAAAGCTP